MPDLKPTKDLVNAAIEVADEFPVFPCDENKRPVCSGGFKAATQDPDEIVRLFSIKGAALIGIPTGEASGLSVIDIDVRDGKQGLEWEKKNAEILGLTKKAKTQSDGRHYYYNHKDGIRNRKGIDGCVDIRGDGGYVIHPASDGYEWLNDEDFADFPSDFAASSQAPAPVASNSIDRWGKLTDGREAKMAEMVYAKCLDAVREVGFDKAYDKVIAEYPDYERLVAARGESLEADGRGRSEWKTKIRSTLAKFEREGVPEPRRPQASDRRNEPVVFNMIDDEVIRVSDGQTYTRTAFQAGTGRKVTEEIKEGLIEVVDGTAFEPAAADARIIWVNGHKMFNRYPICPIPMADRNYHGHPAAELIINHIKKMFSANADFVLDWMSFQVQHYGEKLRFAAVIVGVQGDGKTMIFDKLTRALVGHDHVKTVSPVQVNEPYNDWAANIGVVVVEELMVQGANKQQVIDEFKPLVTNDTIAISEKYKSARQVRNTANFVILTNHLNALPIASDDRRFHVVKTSTETPADLPTPSQFEALHNAIDNHADVLRGYFLDRDLTGFNINQPPPSTSAKELMREMQLNDEQLWVMDVLQNPERGYRQECFSLSIVRAHLKQEHGFTLAPRNTEAKLNEIGYLKYGQLKFDNKNHTIYVHRDLKAENPSGERIRAMLEHPTSDYSNYDQDEFPV